MQDLDLRAVRCLAVLEEERHFGRAAARLHMSQPGLSRVISALETRLGAILVVRATRPVRLTPRGNTLVRYGRRLLALQQDAFNELIRDDTLLAAPSGDHTDLNGSSTDDAAKVSLGLSMRRCQNCPYEELEPTGARAAHS
jgi:DNA-binding transcriptional LysR family regulator